MLYCKYTAVFRKTAPQLLWKEEPDCRNYSRKSNAKKPNNVLIFLLVFIVFLIVFGGICLWAVIKINEERMSAASSAIIHESDLIQFDESDIRNLLVVTTDEEQGQGFVAIHSNPAKTNIRAFAIPRDTVVDDKTKETRIYEYYASNGITAARDSLAKLLGIKFDNYIVISYENVEKLVDYLEMGIVIRLDEDLNYSEGKFSVNIGGGLRTLTPPQVVKVLRYPAWHGGRKQRADIQAQLAAALINQYLRPPARTKRIRISASSSTSRQERPAGLPFRRGEGRLDFLSENNKEGQICKAVSFPANTWAAGTLFAFIFRRTLADLPILLQ